MAITFIQSGYDKVIDWKGNVEWLKGHFSQTILKNQVPQALLMILVLEILAGAFAVIGIIEIIVNEGTQFAFFAAALSSVTLLLLLLGQRQDYSNLFCANCITVKLAVSCCFNTKYAST